MELHEGSKQSNKGKVLTFNQESTKVKDKNDLRLKQTKSENKKKSQSYLTSEVCLFPVKTD